MKIIMRRSIQDEQNKVPIFSANQLLQRIYQGRGVKSKEELNYDIKNILNYSRLSNIEKAVHHLYEALLAQQRILIIGDYDVDGATSTALTVMVLKEFGFKNVCYLIPNRFEFGYGLSPEVFQAALKQQPDLIITVDNGISSIAGVAAANQHGIKVIITDHHLAGAELPDAAAIVNPNQINDAFESKNLAGVGVTFYLMLALRKHLREQNWFTQQNISEPNMANHLDLVALGTVADLVPLDYNNRILVHHGLARIKSGKCSVGIKALLAVSNRDYARVTANDLAYSIAPKLNAAGRIEDMGLGVECLLTDSLDKARLIVNKLTALNDQRRELEKNMQKQALDTLQSLPLKETEQLPIGLCIFDKTWHQGVIGILAARIKDKLNRPTIAFAVANDEEIKGSARSIPGLHMRDVLENIYNKYPNLIMKFGGHSLAAGLSLKSKDYPYFCEVFNQEVSKLLTSDDLVNIIHTDGELSYADLSLQNAELLQKAGPWGHGFPEPIFDGIFEIVEQRLLAKKHLKMILQLLPQENPASKPLVIDAIHFNADSELWSNKKCTKVKVVYKLDVNEYNGRRSLQLMVDHMEPIFD